MSISQSKVFLIKLQVLKLCGFKRIALLAASSSVLLGRRWTKRLLEENQKMIPDGTADSAVASVTIGGAGLNCQCFNAMVFMVPCYLETMEIQCKGLHLNL
jgi:hypothetical protein